MNTRLRALSVSADQKDTELQELRATIETLKKNRSSDGEHHVISRFKHLALASSVT